jgi:phosphatidylglycerophosphate synthase
MTATIASVVLGLASAGAAATSIWWLAVVLFLAGRLMDGLDGELARANGSASDSGGYADIVADAVVYAAIPIGAAVGSSIDHIWPITAALLASFYLNTMTWTYLSAVIEKRRERARSIPNDGGSSMTAVAMPAGLVEGFETMLFLVVMLSIPQSLDWTMAIMAIAVTAGAAIRFVQGRRWLEDGRSADRETETRVRPGPA